MKVVYEAANNIEAYLLKSRLEHEQVLSWITGEYLQGGIGEMQMHGLARVMVTDVDVERARRVIREYETDVYSGLAPVEFFLTGDDPSSAGRLSDLLRTHPEICLLNLDRMAATATSISTIDRSAKTEYHKQYRHCSTTAVRGEFNREYWSNKAAVTALYRYNPSAKIVVLLAEEQSSNALFSQFDANCLLVLRVEDFQRSSEQVLNSVQDFLGVRRVLGSSNPVSEFYTGQQKNSRRQALFTPILAKLLQSLPQSKSGDFIFSWILFLRAHKRRPTGKMLLNDYLFRLKNSKEMMSPLRQFVSDKALVKHYVSARVGDKYNIKTIALLTSKNDVEAYEFPDTCCIKPTHGSGRVILRRNGEPVDKAEIKAWFDLNYYEYKREVNYRYAEPKVIIEPIVFGGEKGEDYKFFCYNGKVKMLEVDIDRHNNHTRKYYDAEMRELTFSTRFPREMKDFPLPVNMPEMMEVAEKLSGEFSFIRIDLYSDGKNIYLGEITNCPANASNLFNPKDAEVEVSRLIFDEKA